MRLFLLPVVIGLFAVIIGCGGGGGDPVKPPPVDKTVQWTVMLYMGADNTLAAAALEDLNELEQVGSTDKVKFTALADVYFNYWGQYGLGVVDLLDGNSKPVTPMMLVTKHPEDGVQSYFDDSKAVLYDRIGFNSADPANLTNFIKWSVQRFPAKHYALVVWDHGNGWLPGRIGSAILEDDSDASNGAGSTGGAMYVHQLQSAIANSGIHLDLLDFDACNMASVEVAYQLKDVTKYICASQRTEPGNGNDYTAIASYMTAHPSATAEEFGREIINSYVAFYQNPENDQGSVTRSLIRTDKLAAIAGAVNQVTPLLSDPKVISSEQLRTAFNEPIRFLGDVDLCNLANVMPYHAQNASLNSALSLVKQRVAEAVLYDKVFVSSQEVPDWTFGARQSSQGQDTQVNGVSGLSIFLPTEEYWNQNSFSYYSSIGFTQASGWNWVIAHAYDGHPYLPTALGGWLAELVWSTGVDLDMWVFEPDGSDGFIPASPCLGSVSTSGYLSPDSRWTGIPIETYQAKQEVIDGPYFFLATYYGPNLFAHDAYCMLGIFGSPTDTEPAITTNAYYISATAPNDPDFGQGVVFFGFALYDTPSDTWYFYENDRTGESVSPKAIPSIKDHLQSIGPKSTTAPLRQPASVDQKTIDRFNAQGKVLAKKLRDKLSTK
jgi:hypothetical protein